MARREQLDLGAAVARRAAVSRRVPPRFISFRRLEAASFGHSTIYLSLLLCAFVLGNVQPETLILGWAHGIVWIVMSMLCIYAARRGVIPFWLAILVAVLGGLGPFAGTIGFLVAERRRSAHGGRGPTGTQ